MKYSGRFCTAIAVNVDRVSKSELCILCEEQHYHPNSSTDTDHFPSMKANINKHLSDPHWEEEGAELDLMQSAQAQKIGFQKQFDTVNDKSAKRKSWKVGKNTHRLVSFFFSCSSTMASFKK